MKKITNSFRWWGLLIFIILLTSSCKQQRVQGNGVDLDNDMLKDWASKIIMPAYNDYQSRCQTLFDAAEQFEKNPTEDGLNNLKAQWEKAYFSFQKMMIFDFSISSNTYLLGMSDTYPTQPQSTKERKMSIEGNIQLIKEGQADKIDWGYSGIMAYRTYQGFPALDYLLFSPGKDLTYYQNNLAARTYVTMLCKTLLNNIQRVTIYWKRYQTTYGNDRDNSAQSAFSKTVNAFIRVYEKQIRAFKVGYAAGAIREQGGAPAPNVIEAFYNEKISKDLLKTALQSSQDFFNGKTYDKSKTVKSLYGILEDKGQKQLADDINRRYDIIYKAIDEFPYTLKEAAKYHRQDLKNLYDLIQANVLNFKTKMIAAMNVQPNYVDTDGD